jgi:hypothetical protein
VNEREREMRVCGGERGGGGGERWEMPECGVVGGLGWFGLAFAANESASRCAFLTNS